MKSIKVMQDGMRGRKVLLPTKWCNDNDVRVGDSVAIQAEGDTLIIRVEKEKRNEFSSNNRD